MGGVYVLAPGAGHSVPATLDGGQSDPSGEYYKSTCWGDPKDNPVLLELYHTANPDMGFCLLGLVHKGDLLP